jgi:hypothetical protein
MVLSELPSDFPSIMPSELPGDVSLSMVPSNSPSIRSVSPSASASPGYGSRNSDDSYDGLSARGYSLIAAAVVVVAAVVGRMVGIYLRNNGEGSKSEEEHNSNPMEV